ncbi:MAG: T9SS type A sorting domain-containing protein [Bacteroidetes bacterium]|nr:T9SS type A sorting domain-containing protein [Bacteroidota bacterium]
MPSDDSEEKDFAVADFDQDGWTDVVVVRKQPFSSVGPRADLLLMNENGTLVDRTLTYAPEFTTRLTDARDVWAGDLDMDGWADVLVASTFEDPPVYYHNLGEDGSGNWLGFADESATRLPTITIPTLQFCALWAGDLTGDGAPEIYFSNYDPGGLAFDVLLINDGSGVFTDETFARMGNLRNSAFGTSTEIHDMDGDGDNDIVKISTLFDVAPWNDIGVFVLFNDGAGFFSNWMKPPSGAPYMFTVGDLDENGLRDIYIVDDGQDYVDLAQSATPDVSIQYTQNTLSNSPRTTGFGGNVKLADLDLDGDLDLAIADVDVDIPPCESGGGSNRKFTMLQNEGDATGTLSDPWGTQDNAWNVSTFDFALLDIDNDTDLDLLLGVCSGYMVFLQDGSPAAFDLNLGLGNGPNADEMAYKWLARNPTEMELKAHVWMDISGPEGYFDVVFRAGLTLDPGEENVDRDIYTFLPGASDGAYTVTLYSGQFDDVVLNTVTRTFIKSGSTTIAAETSSAENSTALPETYRLNGNYPNPFNPSTTIRYAVPEEAHIRLDILDVLGRHVATLVDDIQNPGYYRVVWNGLNEGGTSVASGVYFARLQAGITLLTQRMLLMK